MAQDVARGYVTDDAAARDYGVVLTEGGLDVAATTALRAEMADPQPHSHFHFGRERDTFEAVWTREAYAQMTQLMAGLPVHWRFFVKTELFARLGEHAETLQEAFEQVRTRFPQVPDVAIKAEI